MAGKFDATPPAQKKYGQTALGRKTLATQGDFRRGLHAGVNEVGALADSAVGAVQAGLGFEGAARENIQQANEQFQTAHEVGPRVTDIFEADGLGDVVDWLQGQVGKQLPILAATVGGGMAGLGTRGVLAAAGRSGAAKAAGYTGLGVPAVGLETGSIFNDLTNDEELKETSLQELAGISLAGGAVAGSLEALSVFNLFNKFGVGGAAKKGIKDHVLKRASKGAINQAAVEGVTEGLQTVVERGAHKFANENFEVFGEEGYREIVNAMLTGAAVGGTLGGFVGIATPNSEADVKTAVEGEKFSAEFGELDENNIAILNDYIEQFADQEFMQQNGIDRESLARVMTYAVDEQLRPETAKIIDEQLSAVFPEYGMVIDGLQNELRGNRSHIEQLMNTEELGEAESAFLPSNPEESDDESSDPNVLSRTQEKTKTFFRNGDVSVSGLTLDKKGKEKVVQVEGWVKPEILQKVLKQDGETALRRDMRRINKRGTDGNFEPQSFRSAFEAKLKSDGLNAQEVKDASANRGQILFEDQFNKNIDWQLVYDKNDPAAFLDNFEVPKRVSVPGVFTGQDDTMLAETEVFRPFNKLKNDGSGKQRGQPVAAKRGTLKFSETAMVRRERVDSKVISENSASGKKQTIQVLDDTKHAVDVPLLAKKVMTRQGIKSTGNPKFKDIKKAVLTGLGQLRGDFQLEPANFEQGSLEESIPDDAIVFRSNRGQRVAASEIDPFRTHGVEILQEVSEMRDSIAFLEKQDTVASRTELGALQDKKRDILDRFNSAFSTTFKDEDQLVAGLQNVGVYVNSLGALSFNFDKLGNPEKFYTYGEIRKTGIDRLKARVTGLESVQKQLEAKIAERRSLTGTTSVKKNNKRLYAIQKEIMRLSFGQIPFIKNDIQATKELIESLEKRKTDVLKKIALVHSLDKIQEGDPETIQEGIFKINEEVKLLESEGIVLPEINGDLYRATIQELVPFEVNFDTRDNIAGTVENTYAGSTINATGLVKSLHYQKSMDAVNRFLKDMPGLNRIQLRAYVNRINRVLAEAQLRYQSPTIDEDHVVTVINPELEIQRVENALHIIKRNIQHSNGQISKEYNSPKTYDELFPSKDYDIQSKEIKETRAQRKYRNSIQELHDVIVEYIPLFNENNRKFVKGKHGGVTRAIKKVVHARYEAIHKDSENVDTVIKDLQDVFGNNPEAFLDRIAFELARITNGVTRPLFVEIKQDKILITPKADRPVLAKDNTLYSRMSGIKSNNKHFAKDLAKAEGATHFVGNGVEGSSTNLYHKALKGEGSHFISTSRVFVSANGNRKGRLSPVNPKTRPVKVGNTTYRTKLKGPYVALVEAAHAGATIVTDTKAHRGKKGEYNVGEQEIAIELNRLGYVEHADSGVWISKKVVRAQEVVTPKGKKVASVTRSGFGHVVVTDTNIQQDDITQELRSKGYKEQSASGVWVSPYERARRKVKPLRDRLEELKKDRKSTPDEIRVVRLAYRAAAAKVKAENIKFNLDEGNRKFRKTSAKNMDGMQKAEQGIIDKAVKAFGLGEIIYNTGESNLVQINYDATAVTYSIDGVNYIELNSRVTNPALRLAALTHEIGHIILNQHWEKASSETRASVLAEFETWREMAKGAETTAAVNASKKTVAFFANPTNTNMESLNTEEQEYMLDFEEWVADQTSRWFFNNVEPTSMADKFFKKLSTTLKTLYDLMAATAGFKPTESIDTFMRESMNPNFSSYDHAVHDLQRIIPQELGLQSETVAAALSVYVSRGGNANTAIEDILERYFVDPKSPISIEDKRVVRVAMNTPFVRKQLEALGINNLGGFFIAWEKGDVKLGPKVEGVFNKVWNKFRGVFGIVANSEKAELVLDAVLTAAAGGRKISRQKGVLNDRLSDKGLKKVGRTMSKVYSHAKPLMDRAWVPSYSRMMNTGSKPLQDLANLFFVGPGQLNKGESFFEGKTTSTGRLHEFLAKRLEFIGDNQELRAAVLHKLQTGEEANSSSKADIATRGFRSMFQDMRKYGVESGLAMGEIENYFPWVFDVQSVEQNSEELMKFLKQDKFKAGIEHLQKEWVIEKYVTESDSSESLLGNEFISDVNKYLAEKHQNDGIRDSSLSQLVQGINTIRKSDRYDGYKMDTPEVENKVVEKIVYGIIYSEGYADSNLHGYESGYSPYMSSVNKRSLQFVQDLGNQDDMNYLSSMFQDSLEGITNVYINQIVKKAEYTKRFGEKGEQIEDLIEEAKKQGATEADVRLAEQFVNSALGKHGEESAAWLSETFGMEHDSTEIMNPTLQKGMSALLITRNLAILGLSTFTSLADVTGILVRSGDLNTAFTAFKVGMEDVKMRLGGDVSETRKLAKSLGTIEHMLITEALQEYYGTTYMNSGLKSINDKFFEWIQLNRWTRFTRVMALGGAKEFLKTHKDGNHNKNSKRFLEELGLKPGDIKLTKAGELKVLLATQRKKATPEEIARDDRVRTALNRFVDQAILRPNAAHRTIWMSDPHWMLVTHLKQFMYSFHTIILKRIVNEAAHGNYKPFMMLWMFIPVMAAADWTRDRVQYMSLDGSPRKANWGIEDHVWSAMQRSGMLGLGQMVADAGRDMSFGGRAYDSLAGPSFDTMTSIDDLILDSDSGRWSAFTHQLPLQNVVRHWGD